MEQIWGWGLAVIHTVQSVRTPYADLFFKGVSFFGSLMFYILFLPVFYWCFDKRESRRLLVIFFISGWLNTVMKDFFAHPRPYVLDESVKIGNTGGYGLPSGHAQLSATVWGYLSVWRRETFFRTAALVLMLLIAFSRIYLGVHFPTDIFGGWILALLILFAGYRLFPKFEQILRGVNPVMITVLLIAATSLMSLVNASKSSVMSMGALCGYGIGLLIETRYIDFVPAADFRRGLLRYISGMVLLLVLYMAGRVPLLKNISAELLFVYIQSLIIGFWISAGAPYFYKKFRI